MTQDILQGQNQSLVGPRHPISGLHWWSGREISLRMMSISKFIQVGTLLAKRWIACQQGLGIYYQFPLEPGLQTSVSSKPWPGNPGILNKYVQTVGNESGNESPEHSILRNYETRLQVGENNKEGRWKEGRSKL